MTTEKTNTSAKLAAVEARLKRWQTKLRRATNEVTKLDRQRRRLQAKMGPVNLTHLIGPPLSTKDVGADQAKPAKNYDAIEEKAKEIVGMDDIPNFLDRRDPVVAEAMTKARHEKEAELRSRMPLSGKAALDMIKRKRKAK